MGNDQSQLDLFSDQRAGSQSNISNNDSLVKKIWVYEKAILILIAILVVGIIAFSLGVEKGKRISLERSKEIFKQFAAIKSTPIAAIPAQKATVKPVPVVQKQIPAIAKTPVKGSFTIQLGSFKTKPALEAEIIFLRNKGFNPTITGDGRVSTVCIGSFVKKEDASLLCGELKKYKKYEGCFIRRF